MPKWGDIVKKAINTASGNPESVRCVTAETSAAESLNADGNRYIPGKCVYAAPVSRQQIDKFELNLTVVNEIGWQPLYNAFNAILDHGASAMPGTGIPIDVRMNASIQAVKTVARDEKEVYFFLNWFAYLCRTNSYTDVVAKLFDPLKNVADSVVPTLGSKTIEGKEKLSLRGGRGDGGAGRKGGASGRSGISLPAVLAKQKAAAPKAAGPKPAAQSSRMIRRRISPQEGREERSTSGCQEAQSYP